MSYEVIGIYLASWEPTSQGSQGVCDSHYGNLQENSWEWKMLPVKKITKIIFIHQYVAFDL